MSFIPFPGMKHVGKYGVEGLISLSDEAWDAGKQLIEHSDDVVRVKGADEINYVYFNKTHQDSLPKPKGDGPNGGKLQSHHGLQQEWAKNNLSQNGYDSKLAPTITIETGKGLPHTIITNAQTARRNERMASGVGK